MFIDLIKGLFVLEKAETENDLRNIEVIIVLRILNNLGYIGGNETLQNLVQSPFEENLIFEVAKITRDSLAPNQQSSQGDASIIVCYNSKYGAGRSK